MSKQKLAHDTVKKVRTKDVIINDDVTFEGMMLSDQTLQGLNQCGFMRPSPVQLKAVPLGRCGFDLLVEGKSGTGKTLIFSIVALEMIDVTQGLQSIVVAPTREIAIQISDVISAIGCYHKGLKVSVITGGTDIEMDKILFSKTSETVHILVASPGRLRYLISKNVISTQSVKLFVLDEADKLMSGAFLEDVNYFYNVLPKRKQVIATSATYTDKLRNYVARYMNLPSHIKPDQSSILLGLNQYFVLTTHHDNTYKQIIIKFDELRKILSSLPFNQCLVFCNYQARAKLICDMLRKENWPTSYIAGSQSQSERITGLRNLQSFGCRILVATDLAARGLDAANVDLVINFDKPYELPTYLHRIGRAGRYGSFGNAITILSNHKEEENFWRILHGLNEEIKIQNLWDGKFYSVADRINNVINDGDIMDSLGRDILNIVIKTKSKEENAIGDISDLIKSLNDFETKSDTNCDGYETIDSLIDSLDNFQEIDEIYTNPRYDIYTLNSQCNNIFNFIQSTLNSSKLALNLHKNLQSNRGKEEQTDLTDENSSLANGVNLESEIQTGKIQTKKGKNAFRHQSKRQKKISGKLISEPYLDAKVPNKTNPLAKSDLNTSTYEKMKKSKLSKKNSSITYNNNESVSSSNDSDSFESESSDSESDEEDYANVECRNGNAYYFRDNLTNDRSKCKPFSYNYYRMWKFNLALQSEFIRQSTFIKELSNWNGEFN